MDDIIEHAKMTLGQYLGLDIGVFDMYALEPPIVPDLSVVIVAKAEAAEKSKERAIGYCFPAQYIAPGETSKVFLLDGAIDPRGEAIGYFSQHMEIFENPLPFSAIQLIKEPEHGTVYPYKPIKDGPDYWRYLPEEGYIGNDQVEFLVDVHGIPVHVFYFIKVGPPGFGIDSEEVQGLCNGEYQWIISQPPAEDYNDLASWIRSSSLSWFLSNAQSTLSGFVDLSGASVAQTTGTGPSAQITLDTDAAGHGWFIDYTPYLNEEWLPTSNPYEWQAKSGSDAEGKMDMLSVLLHEYGHVLGLEHTTDTHDFMATTLQPGVRRLPSADELQLMANLVAELKGEMGLASSSSPQTPDTPSPAPLLLLSEGPPISANSDVLAEQQAAEFSDFDLDINIEELDMLFFALPDAVPQTIYETSMIVAAKVPATLSPRTVRKMTFGLCQIVGENSHDGGVSNRAYSLDKRLMRKFLPQNMQDILNTPNIGGAADIDWNWLADWEDSFKTTVLRYPQHGKLAGEGLTTNNTYAVYRPDMGYVGKDRIDLLVEGRDDKGSDIALTLRYYINVLPRKELHRIAYEKGAFTQALEKYCNVKKEYWRISENQNGDSSPPDLLSGVQGESSGYGTHASWYRAMSLQVLLAGARDAAAGFTDITGSALAQTTGSQITLDANAAGHGWFIDYTPYLNEEWLPTSNPYEWQAKPGSDAEGKMDLLSVLLHEYGHVLGLEHTTDAHDFMSTTLQPGVRRLPSADELQLMANLVAELKGEMGLASSSTPQTPDTPSPAPLPASVGLAAFLAARQRRNDSLASLFANGTDGSPSAAPTQYETAANPKLTDANFESGSGWSTSGDVAFTEGSALLKETASSQTRLNQVFVLGENDRILTFTLSGIALDDVDNAPDDAFEVALIDANTGLSLLGSTGLVTPWQGFEGVRRSKWLSDRKRSKQSDTLAHRIPWNPGTRRLQGRVDTVVCPSIIYRRSKERRT